MQELTFPNLKGSRHTQEGLNESVFPENGDLFAIIAALTGAL